MSNITLIKELTLKEFQDKYGSVFIININGSPLEAVIWTWGKYDLCTLRISSLDIRIRLPKSKLQSILTINN